MMNKWSIETNRFQEMNLKIQNHGVIRGGFWRRQGYELKCLGGCRGLGKVIRIYASKNRERWRSISRSLSPNWIFYQSPQVKSTAGEGKCRQAAMALISWAGEGLFWQHVGYRKMAGQCNSYSPSWVWDPSLCMETAEIQTQNSIKLQLHLGPGQGLSLGIEIHGCRKVHLRQAWGHTQCSLFRMWEWRTGEIIQQLLDRSDWCANASTSS
jgi:hypothetical protein